MGNHLALEVLSGGLFKAGNHLGKRDGFRSAKADDAVRRLGVVHRGDDGLGDVEQGNPADRAVAVTEQPRFGVFRLEAERRAQPDFAEMGGVQDGIGHTAGDNRRLDRPLGVLQGERGFVGREGDENEPACASPFGGLYQVQLPLTVNGLDIVAFRP